MLGGPVSIIIDPASEPRSPRNRSAGRPRPVVCLMRLGLPMRLTVAGQHTDLVRIPLNLDKVV